MGMFEARRHFLPCSFLKLSFSMSTVLGSNQLVQGMVDHIWAGQRRVVSKGVYALLHLLIWNSEGKGEVFAIVWHALRVSTLVRGMK